MGKAPGGTPGPKRKASCEGGWAPSRSAFRPVGLRRGEDGGLFGPERGSGGEEEWCLTGDRGTASHLDMSFIDA